MKVKFSELKQGTVFYLPADHMCEHMIYIKSEKNGYNAWAISGSPVKRRIIQDDEDVNVWPVLYDIAHGKKKWWTVCGFYGIPRDTPRTAKPDHVFAKFTSYGDARIYARDICTRPTTGYEYHLIVVR